MTRGVLIGRVAVPVAGLTAWVGLRPFGISPGLYYVPACADDTSAVPESDEAGNCRATTAPVAISWRHPWAVSRRAP